MFLLASLPVLAQLILNSRDKLGRAELLHHSRFMVYKQINLLWAGIVMFICTVQQGMKHSNNFRKFFIHILILGLIILQFVDIQASTYVVTHIASNDGARIYEADATKAFVTSPLAAIVSIAITVLLFKFKFTDCMLTVLHNNNKIFALNSFLVFFLLLSSRETLIIAEITYLIIFAAKIYPNRAPADGPTPIELTISKGCPFTQKKG